MARILLADTNFSSGPIRSALLKLGHTVYLAGGNPNDFLARNTPNYLQVDYSNPDALANAVKEHSIDILMPGCNDLSYKSCSRVSHELGLDSIGLDTFEQTEQINRKDLFRQLGRSAGLRYPRWFEGHELPDCAVIVKPVDSFSGKGITYLKFPDRKHLEEAKSLARGVSASGACVVEQWIEGQLYSHSAFYMNGSISRDFVVVEHGSANPWVVDTSCVIASVDQGLLDDIRSQSSRLFDTLGLNDGLVHTQFIASEGKAWPIEVTRRCPGDLYSQLIELSTGFDYPKAYAAAFTGDLQADEGIAQQEHRWVMRHTLTVPKPQMMSGLSFSVLMDVLKWVPVAQTGDFLQASPISRIALLFARCASENELKELMNRTLQRELYEVETD